MGTKNDRCDRCDQESFYEGHASWCYEISLVDIKGLIELLEKILLINREEAIKLLLTEVER
jgi:hypothetical protein